MVPIKIQCDCGQKCAFEVEPVHGRMPSPISCPTCGADGTGAANESIALQLPPTPVPVSPIRMISPGNPAAHQPTPSSVPMPPPPPAPVQPATPAPVPPPSIHLSTRNASAAATAASPRADLRRGLVDRDQAAHEARAKAMWGDSKDQIKGYLLLQGFAYEEANEMTTALFKERAAAVRANGIRKFLIGFGLMWVPVIAFIFFRIVGMLPLKLMGACILVGVYGVYLEISGILMAVAPKSEKGDMADQ